MHSIYKTLARTGAAAVLMLGAAGGAMAQNLNSAYFTDGYLYGYQLNPSFANDKNFVSIPAIGNFNIGMQGTLHLNEVIYNINGKTTTFMNPGVDAAKFLDDLGSSNRIGVDLRANILSGGFKAFGGYNTISIGARANVNAKLPREAFRLLKQGVENDTYDINDLGANATVWAEIGLGHSHQINEKLRIGATLKFLIGGGNVDATLNRADLTLGTDSWDAVTEADIHASVKGLSYDTDVNEHTGHRYVSGADIDGGGINGFGLAFDLGATYRLNDDWTFSAALLDLGFINWSNDILASTNGEQHFTTDKYTFSVRDKDDFGPGEVDNSFETELDKVRDDLSALYELNDMGDQGGRNTMLGATLNLGAEYTFPLYRKLSFGLLNTTRIQGEYTWTDFRLSANVAPVKVFSAGANIGVGTFGFSFGWILNLHCPGFNLFLASDHTPGKLAKPGVPLSSNANVSLGMNVQF